VCQLGDGWRVRSGGRSSDEVGVSVGPSVLSGGELCMTTGTSNVERVVGDRLIVDAAANSAVAVWWVRWRTASCKVAGANHSIGAEGNTGNAEVSVRPCS